MDDIMASTGLVIRPAIPADGEILGRFGALLVAQHHDFDPARFMAASDETPPNYGRYLVSQMDEPDVILLVAEEDGDVRGYVYAEIEGPDYMTLRGPAGVLHDLFVAPDSRSKGIGKVLLDKALGMIKDRGMERVVLSTAHRNQAAQRLFASRGFRPTMIEMTRDL